MHTTTTATRKLFSVFLAFVLAFGLMPLPAFAEGGEEFSDVGDVAAGDDDVAAADDVVVEDVVEEGTAAAAAGADLLAGDTIPVDLEDIAFVYVESPSVSANSVENIVIALADEGLDVEVAWLEVAEPDGAALSFIWSDFAEGAALFAIDVAALDLGDYEITAVRYRLAGDDAVYEASFVQDDAAAYSFEVMEATESAVDEDGLVTGVYTIDPDGEYVEAESIESGMAAAGVDPAEGPGGQLIGEDGLTTQANGEFIIVLDPGHGGYDGGATGIGFQEKDVNLRIAQYCKMKLEEVPGVTVFMTRSSDVYVSLGDRVNFAKNHGADLVVSIHNNAGGGRGAEVIVPRNGSWYYQETYVKGTALGKTILSKLNALGLGTHNGVYSRDCTNGETYPDGTLSDYYTLIDGPRRAGILGIIVEHAFVDNASDAAFLNNESNLRRLGEADAQAIIEYYDLQTNSADFSAQGRPLYRLYNPKTDEHHYTLSSYERDVCMSQWGWNYEGIAWYCPDSSSRPVYRLYNPQTNLHHYTLSAYERDVCASQWGWNYEGIAWYAAESGNQVYRLYHPKTDRHHYTLSAYERDVCVSKWGWNYEGVAWFSPFESADASSGLAASSDDEAITGSSSTSTAQMVRRYNAVGKTYPSSTYSQYGASSIDQFCQILYEEATAEGVRPEVVFAQAMHETGWLQFNGDVKAGQCNFAGIGATGGGAAGASFNTYGANSVRMGLRVQVQHLKAYASKESCKNEIVDPRFNMVTRGSATTVQALSGKWATDSGYGDALVAQISALLKA